MMQLTRANRASFSSVGFIQEHNTTEIFKDSAGNLYKLGEDNVLIPYDGPYILHHVPANIDKSRGIC